MFDRFGAILVPYFYQIINRSYHEAKINYFKKRIDRYRDKDPGVPLNELYSEQQSILSSISESQDEIKRMEEILTRKTSSITFQNIAMDSKVKDNPEMLDYVKNSIKKCKDLIDNH